MVELEIAMEVEFLPSFYNKLNKSALITAQERLVEKLTQVLEEECVKECPVRTGNLRDSHYVVLNGLESYVGNNTDYAPYVIYGTSKQSPNNYPQRAIRNTITSTYLRLVFEDYMQYGGIEFTR